MNDNGKVRFDQGMVVDNIDPERLGRVKVRMISDGLDIKDTMHKGDDELQWYEPCVMGAGYEMGSLTVPPVGAFVWCLECEFNTENVYRVYLGSSYGAGPVNSKNFNGMLTPPSVIETPVEALLDYPYTQLLYKSSSGSYMRFYGDSLSGFDICTGIPVRDAEGNAQTADDYTYNYLYGDRKELAFSVSEMPSPQDKADPAEPKDKHISYINMDSDRIFSGFVRDRGGDVFNNQQIDASGIYMTVRGTGGTTSPSENKDLEDAVEDNIDKAASVAQQATEKASEEVQQENGVMEAQEKVTEQKVEQSTNDAVNAPCKCDSNESGITKKEASGLEKSISAIAEKVPGGKAFIQSTIANALHGNTKAILVQGVQIASTVLFSLLSDLLKDVFKDILANPNIINTEEASKFIDKIIGEANLNKLVGKAQEMIAIVGGKLGPFGQVFERVANTVLGVATSKLGVINEINNKLAGIAQMKKMFDQMKPNLDQLLDQGLEMAKQMVTQVCIDQINKAIKTGTVPNDDIRGMAADAMSHYLGGLFDGKDKNKENSGEDKDKENGSPGDDTTGGQQSQGSGNPTDSQQTPEPSDPGTSNPPENQETPNPEGGSSSNPPDSTEGQTEEEAPQLTEDEKKAIGKLSEVCVNCAKKAIQEAVENVTNSLISKALTNAAEESEISSEATKEYENIIYLDADGARAAVPGEEISNCAVLNNDGAEVHVGGNCLLQMSASNIMNFVSDPDYKNQTSRIMASDGTNETTDSETCSHTARNDAEYAMHFIKSADEKYSAGWALGYKPDEESVRCGSEVSKNKKNVTSIMHNESSANLNVKTELGESSISMKGNEIVSTVNIGSKPSIQITDNEIVMKVGTSSISMKDGEITIFAPTVNIGAGLTLAYLPDDLPDDMKDISTVCHFNAPKVESKSIDWSVDGTINFV